MKFFLLFLVQMVDAWLAAQIRAAARVALISKDASDKVRRAMLRKAPTISNELIPGCRVYFGVQTQ